MLPKDQIASENVCIQTTNRFAALEYSTDVEEHWQMFVSGITDSTANILGRKRGANRERWISCETWELIDERKRTNTTRDQTKDSQMEKHMMKNAGKEKDIEVK